ncbi:MAG TPA: prepilin-type N-terminal cleavage/methylation domain-containing protein [Pirellulales bacterium]|nr:prepilin-type N-terminal cleavage/methylation domain-containing protein [Pirellulales bacterium]
MKRRAGYCLVEAMVAISISSVLASLALGLIGALVRADHSGRRHLRETQSLARLARQFRDDVASADAVTLADDSAQLELRLAGGRAAVYTTEPGRATREELADGARQRHESFVLPEASRLALEIDRDRQPAMARLSLVRLSLVLASDADKSAGAKGARAGWRVEAAVGRALRLAGKPTEGGAKSSPASEENRP